MYNWLFLFHDPLAQVSLFFYLIDISLFILFGLLCLPASEGKSSTVENEVRGPPISAKYPSTRTVAEWVFTSVRSL